MTRRLIEVEMAARGGLFTRSDLAVYGAVERPPLRGMYRGYDILAMPPVSSGGTAVVQILDILDRGRPRRRTSDSAGLLTARPLP